MKITIQTVGNVTIEHETKSVKDIIELSAFFQSLPTVCPIDGEPTIFSHRSPSGNDYYELLSTGPRPFACQIHQNKEGDGMYCQGVWTIYDHASGNRITVWEHGALTEQGQKYTTGRPIGTPQVVTMTLAKTQVANGKPLTKKATGELIENLDAAFDGKGEAILTYLAGKPVSTDAPPSAQFASVQTWLDDTSLKPYEALVWIAAQQL